jgi:hypothetical protein
VDPKPGQTEITPPQTQPDTMPAPAMSSSEPLAAATTEPVLSAVGRPAASRTRWLIGGGLAVAAIAAIALAASFLAASPPPEVLKYVPADSAIVVELRPELPGDQRQHLGNLLAHFPGFEDQSTLDAKIDEVLERLTREASNGEIDYRTRVKPLLAGPMAISVTAEALDATMVGGNPDGVLVAATTDGSATCESIFGRTGVSSTHRQVDIKTIDRELACALHRRYLLVGTVTTIEASLDARLDGTSIDADPTYRSARSELEGDQVASIFLDLDPVYDSLLDAVGTLGVPVAEIPEGLWVVLGVRLIDDAVIFDTYSPVAASALPSGGPTSAPAAESRFAAKLPADTLGFVEVHGVGASIQQGLGALGGEPATADVLQALEDALQLLGGAGNLTGWIEDVAIAVVPTDDSVGAAVLIRGKDAEAATARLSQIRNLLILASTGTDITLSDSDHDGVTVTTVDFGDVSSVLGSMGIPGAEVGRLEIAFAVRDDVVVIAGGGGTVERILDVESGSSLATSGTYVRAIDLAGPRNNLQLFVALDATLTLAEGFLPAAELETWTTELKPYLDHLAGIGVTSVTTDTTGRSRVVITIK